MDNNIAIAPERHRRQPGQQHRQRHPVARALGLGLGGLLALYLVGRGVAEFFIVHYNDPASYHSAWGGPSLAGVFAVHSGPAVAIVVASGIYLCRRWRMRRGQASLTVRPAGNPCYWQPVPLDNSG
jgi:hypothetical protein